MIIIVLLGAVTFFLVSQSYPAFIASNETIQSEVGFTRGMSFWQFAGAALFGTVLGAHRAMRGHAIRDWDCPVHLSLRSAPLCQALGYVIDLLAAIPSVVFGLWGMHTLEPVIRPIFAWISDVLTPVMEWWVTSVPGMGYMVSKAINTSILIKSPT